MLTSVHPPFRLRFASQLTININGHDIPAKSGESVLQVANRNGIFIPRLCYHPCLALQGSCGVCAIQTTNKAGKTSVGNACVTKVSAGLKIDTLSEKAIATAKKQLQSLLNVHDERCGSCVANSRCEFRPLIFGAQISNPKRSPPIPNSVDLSTFAIQIDPSKCVACARCVRACKNISGQKVLKVASKAGRRIVQTSAPKLNTSACVRCGQCTLYCPVGAITEQSQASEVLSALRKREKKLYIAQLDASVGPGLSEAFGLPAGTISTGKAVAALKAIGFDFVFDTTVANSANVAETARQWTSSEKVYFTSTCPAFVNFIERSRPDQIPQLSTVRTPASILSGVVKRQFAEGKGLKQTDLYVVAVGSCLARKEEIQRKQLEGLTDVALTARELVALIKFSGINFYELKDAEFDPPYVGGSGAFAISGGVIAAILRRGRARKGIGKLEGGSAPQKGTTTSYGTAVVIQGLAEALKFLEKLKKGDPTVKDVKLVEVLACPGGCVAGGGSVKPGNKEVVEARVAAVMKLKGGERRMIDVSQDLLLTSFEKVGRK
jgi:NADH-quinone oxidoreductase subunit G